ncbi:MAG TPA: DUF1802 family protein [Acidimicrobiia bacterium]|nr:DUF1802 family protein [Acidimicrobiia bacterium]
MTLPTDTRVSTPAFKEWGVIVRALLEGEQILDVRKGGIREDGRHFGLHATRLWLYPTAEHQRPELLKAPYRHWVDLEVAAAPPDRAIRIPGWADIVGVATLTEPEHLAALDSKLIWASEYAASRLNWKRRDPLWVLALRVHQLCEPIVVPWREEYGGCTSWVELDGLPDDPTALPSRPALSDVAFDAKLQGVVNDLPVELRAPTSVA